MDTSATAALAGDAGESAMHKGMIKAVLMAALAATACGGKSTSEPGKTPADITFGTPDAADAKTGNDAADAKADTAAAPNDALAEVDGSTAGTDAKSDDTGTPKPDAVGDVSADAVGDVSKPATLALADFEKAFVDALCSQLSNCPGEEFSFSSAAACEQFFTAAFAKDAESPLQMVALVGAGKMTYDAEAAAACVATIKQSCAQALAADTTATCVQMFTGTAPDAVACAVNAECKSGFCKLDYSKPACAGQCAQPSKLDGFCVFDDGCAKGLACILGKCGPASGGKLGDPCSDTTCGAGLYCEQTGEGTSECMAKVGKDQACTLPSQCEKGLHCGLDPISFAGVCTPPADVGQACKPDAGAESFGPGQGTACVTGSVCSFSAADKASCLPVVASGQPCSHPFQCDKLDLTCVGWTPGGKGVCGAYPKQGETCIPPGGIAGKYQSCQDYLPCVGDQPVCTALPGEGGACSGQCASGFSCVEGMCMAPAKAGEACDVLKGAPCEPGLQCAGTKCVTPICK